MTRPGVLMLVRFAFALLALGSAAPPPAAAQAVQTLLDTDGFDGTDNTAFHSYNANWVVQASATENDCRIRGTTTAGGSGCADNRTGYTWTNDHWAQLTLTTNLASQKFYVGVRFQTDDTMSGYACGSDFANVGPNYHIARYTNNTRFTLNQGSTAATVADVLNCEIIGTTIILRLNGAVLLTYDTSGDSTKYATGRPGVFLSTSGTTVIADSWRAGSAAQPAQASSGKRGRSR